jgi:hypothetical protein
MSYLPSLGIRHKIFTSFNTEREKVRLPGVFVVSHSIWGSESTTTIFFVGKII